MASGASNTYNETIARRTLWLAVGIFGAFFGFYGFALYSGIMFSSPDDYSGVKEVASTLGPIVATIIGFYFGQRPVGELADKLKNTAGDATKSVQTYDDSYEKIKSENNALKETISRQEQTVARNEKSIEILQQLVNDLRTGANQ
jgi:hypothetical protein